jgi:hypothetical protein
VDQRNILSHFLIILCCWQGGPQALSLILVFAISVSAGLLLNAPERPHGYVSLGMRFGWMLELDMTSLLRDLNPAICSKRGNDAPRIHKYLYTSNMLKLSV